jgi:hypothetical protein
MFMSRAYLIHTVALAQCCVRPRESGKPFKRFLVGDGIADHLAEARCE